MNKKDIISIKDFGAWIKNLDPVETSFMSRTKKNKFNAKKTEVDGIIFDSGREAKRYCELKLLEKAGKISDLKPQVKFMLWCGPGKPVKIRSKHIPNGRHAYYKADFVYWEGENEVIEDAKGFDTPAARLKRAVVEAHYGIRINLV